jgi:hypothetical protein
VQDPTNAIAHIEKIERWLSTPSVVVTSEPIRSADKWLVIRGDLVNCHFEQFDSEQAAAKAVRLIQDIQFGEVGVMSSKVIVLTSTQVQTFTTWTTTWTTTEK